MEKTDFVKYVHGLDLVGSTTFAPTNSAFARLGVRANAFLFNTETGHKYLKAILKYHIAPNVTLYTDAIYDSTEEGGSHQLGRDHYELKTLLEGKSVGVDIGSLGAFVSMKVNGFSRVSITDGVAKNGVVQVVDHVLIPPHRHGHGDAGMESVEDISVEELMDRLDGYVEDDDVKGHFSSEL